MKIDVSILQQLAPTYGVQPLGAVPQVVLAINAGASEQAPPEAESILIDAGYTWVENMLAYKNGEQLIFFIAAPQQPFFIWIWKKVLMRAFDTPQKLAKWVSGDEKHPGGKGNKFIELYSKAIGGDDMDRSKGGDITFSGTGDRPDDYQPSKVDPTDALISKLTKQAGPSKKLPSDVMIDIGLKAKKEKNDKLLNFLKTMTPIKEGKIKRSQLEILIKEIVRGILSEGLFGIDDFEDYALAAADAAWGNLNWNVKKSKSGQEGTVYLITNATGLKRLVWRTKQNTWKALDPKTKKWFVVTPDVSADIGSGHNPSENVKEMSGTAAASPMSTPMAFKKDVKEIKTPDDYANEVRAYRQAIINFVGQDNIEKLAKVYVAHGDDYQEDALPKAFWMIADKLPELGIDVTKLTGKEDKSKLLQWIDSQVKGLPLDEMTTTGDVSGYNIPGAFAKKGGSQKGLEGSAALGFTLTPTGEKEMQRRADKLEEGI